MQKKLYEALIKFEENDDPSTKFSYQIRIKKSKARYLDKQSKKKI